MDARACSMMLVQVRCLFVSIEPVVSEYEQGVHTSLPFVQAQLEHHPLYTIYTVEARYCIERRSCTMRANFRCHPHTS